MNKPPPKPPQRLVLAPRKPFADVPIPEPVFTAIQHVETEVSELRRAVSRCASKDDLAELKTSFENSWRSALVKQIGALAIAVLSLIGTMIATRTSPSPAAAPATSAHAAK